MKRGTTRHPKLAKLAQLLHIPRVQAIGHLELLWHFCAEFTPQGNIGKYDDDWIEASLEWTGPRGKLIKSLVTSRWCDKSFPHRLIVHDWHEHCDDGVKKRLARSGLPFLSESIDCVESDRTLSGHVQTLSATLPDNVRLARACLPSQAKPSHATPSPPDGALVPTLLAGRTPDAWATALYARHPKRKGKALVEQALVTILKAAGSRAPELIVQIDACHEAWCQHDDWTKESGRFCPQLAQWLADEGYMAWPNGYKSNSSANPILPEQSAESLREAKRILADPQASSSDRALAEEFVNGGTLH